MPSDLRRLSPKLQRYLGVTTSYADDAWSEPSRDAVVFIIDGRRYEVSAVEYARILPPPDPFFESFMAIAVAKHEVEKRREREAPDA